MSAPSVNRGIGADLDLPASVTRRSQVRPAADDLPLIDVAEVPAAGSRRDLEYTNVAVAS